MTQISISINIDLAPGDLERFGAQLALIARGMALLAPATPETPTSDETPVLGPNIAALPVTPEIAAIPPIEQQAKVTPAVKAEPTAKRPASVVPAAKPVKAARVRNGTSRPRPTLPIDEYDTLVRKEMKRLSIDGRLPNRRVWDEERDQALPTLDAVKQRYKCAGLDELADLMRLEPPLRGYVYTGNGQHETEATP